VSFAQSLARRFVSAQGFRALEVETRKWVVECTTCHHQRDLWDLGGIKYKAYGTSYSFGRCPTCGKRRTHKIWNRVAGGA
jgi:Zn finger protein HypA/HybF involved in hydrogenase expression